MTHDTPSLLALLKEHSIRVRLEGDKLRLSGPPDALTPELKRLVADHKAELIQSLSQGGSQDVHYVAHDAPPQLSIGQEELWRRDQRSPLKYFYLVPRAIRLLGTLEVEQLEHALKSMVQRHAALRTNVKAESHGPVAILWERTSFLLEVLQLEGSPDPEGVAAARIEEETRKPFDVEHDCLIRALLLRISPENHILLINAHHLVADCWSMGFAYQSVQEQDDLWHPGLFFDSLFHLYESVEADGIAELPGKGACTFFDFAASQRSLVASSEGQRQVHAWKSRWSPLPSQRLFPTRSREAELHGQRVAFRVPGELSQSIREVSRQHGVTVHAWLLTAFMTVLSRWKDCPDMVIGMPMAGRRAPEFQSIIGSMGNNVIVRCQIASGVGYLTLVRRVQDEVLHAVEHQDVPIETLHEAFDPDRALPEVRFIMQSPRASRRVTRELEVVPLPLCRGTSKYPLSVTVVDQPSGYRGWAEFLDSCLSPAEFTELMQAYLAALALSTEQPCALVDAFPRPRLSTHFPAKDSFADDDRES